MKRIRLCILLIFLALSLSGCWLKGTGNSGMAFKRITPQMEKRMEYLLAKGCRDEREYLNPEVAMLYSLLPGGGQFYTGETGKGFVYLLSFPFIVPYLVSFQDAQNSVDYYNFKYTIRFCMKKLRLFRKRPQREIVIEEKSEKKLIRPQDF